MVARAPSETKKTKTKKTIPSHCLLELIIEHKSNWSQHNVPSLPSVSITFCLSTQIDRWKAFRLWTPFVLLTAYKCCEATIDPFFTERCTHAPVSLAHTIKAVIKIEAQRYCGCDSHVTFHTLVLLQRQREIDKWHLRFINSAIS